MMIYLDEFDYPSVHGYSLSSPAEHQMDTWLEGKNTFMAKMCYYFSSCARSYEMDIC